MEECSTHCNKYRFDGLDRLDGWMNVWTGRQAGELIDSLIHWLIDRLKDWNIERLMDG